MVVKPLCNVEGKEDDSRTTIMTTCQEKEEQETFLHNLDETLRRLGDVEDSTASAAAWSSMIRPAANEAAVSSKLSLSSSLEETSWIRNFAPQNLETAFQELYNILYPCLRPRSQGSSSSSFSSAAANSTIKEDEDAVETAAAILMGPRGSGKSLLVERCLSAIAAQYHTHLDKLQQRQDQSDDNDDKHDNNQQAQQQPPPKQQQVPILFRKVMVHGILIRGDDVAGVIYEIIRQLSEFTFTEEPDYGDYDDNDNDLVEENKEDKENDLVNNNKVKRSKPKENQSRPKRRRRHNDEYLLRLRKSTFTSNLALLESTLKMAEVDRIPIVLILDELDAFIMLDQKNNNDDRQLLLYHLLDRVATPGSNLTLIGLTSNFTILSQMEKRIRSRAEGTSKVVFVRPPATYEQLWQILLQDKLSVCPILVREKILQLCTLDPTEETMTLVQDQDKQQCQASNLALAMNREFRMGRDIRWFQRVISTALSLYRLDCVVDMGSAQEELPPFSQSFLVEAMTMMGSTCTSDTSTVSTTKQPSLVTVDQMAVDPRLQALIDLSPPQVALVLAARRILVREAHREGQVATAPLTIQRMIQEYQSSFRRGVSKKHDAALLTYAAKQLLERGVLVPVVEHCGGGPLQYHLSLSHLNLHPYSLLRLPLHLPFDMERELDEAIRLDLLDGSTALKEWGRKTN